jgi:hypothetical protein
LNSNSNQPTDQSQHSPASPIEAFNDSNTSEFDDVPGCDSRQDTSLDYQHQHWPRDDSQEAGGGGAGGQLSAAQRRANEQVMDADLRQANRLNLELALLQSAAGQSICGAAGAKPPLMAHGGGRAMLAAADHHHHQYHHLPQSGVLHLASELSGALPTAPFGLAAAQQHRQQFRRRQSSQDDYDSGCVQMPDDSRRSSCLSGHERLPASSMMIGAGGRCDSPSSIASSLSSGAPVPSLRVQIRRLTAGGRRRSDEAEGKSKLTRSGSKESSGRQTKASLFYTLGIGSLGRSSSLNDQADETTTTTDCGKGDSQTSATREPEVYEITLVEARNVLRLDPGQCWAPVALAGAAAAAATDEHGAVTNGRSSPVPGHQHPQTTARRRSSILGALGFGTGAQSPGSQRRSSIDGVFVRVFKAAEDESAAAASAGGRDNNKDDHGHDHQQSGTAGRRQPDDDGLSCGSSAGRPEFIQLPLVKLVSADRQQQQQLQPADGSTTINFQQLARQAYKFTCAANELPVRVSLYMVSKRGGARYTLGHCILSPQDWQQLDCAGGGTPTGAERQLDATQLFWPSNKFVSPLADPFGPASRRRAAKRSLSSGASSNAFGTISERRNSNETDAEAEADEDRGRLGAGESADEQDGLETTGGRAWTLEYRLHQTILEAIKSY